jgi:hypothetical protein
MTWEYRVVIAPASMTVLNEHGAAGWELVAVLRGSSFDPQLVFKRPIGWHKA